MHSASERHPVEYLFDRLQNISYPDGLDLVPAKISGTAFFPGGYGLWREEGRPLPPMPCGKVMVLGQDFGKKEGPQEGALCRARAGHPHVAQPPSALEKAPVFPRRTASSRTPIWGCVPTSLPRVHLRERGTRGSGNDVDRSSSRNRSLCRNLNSSWYSAWNQRLSSHRFPLTWPRGGNSTPPGGGTICTPQVH